MAIYLIDISGKDLVAIKELIREGRFGSVEEFLRVSTINQLVLEKQRDVDTGMIHVGKNPAEVSSSFGTTPGRVQHLDFQQISSYQLISRQTIIGLQGRSDILLEPKPNSHTPLFGQFYRVLPLKIVLRVVAANCISGLVEIGTVSHQVKQLAGDIGAALRAGGRDKRLEGVFNIATGFPSNERDTAKSTSRFESQYLGRIKKSGVADGFGFSLGFLGWRVDNDKVFIGLTESGFKFAMLENPVLDLGAFEALSHDEVLFLVSWIRNELPAEYEHLEKILTFVRGGANTPSALAQLMMKFYLDRFNYDNWTIPKANLMRSGGVSRLVEMRLLTATKYGPRVNYSVNDEMATSVAFQLEPGD